MRRHAAVQLYQSREIGDCFYHAEMVKYLISNYLSSLNKELSLNNEECMFVTLFFGILTIDSGHLVFANAGHNLPIYITSDQDAVFLKTTNSLALGLDADSSGTAQSDDITILCLRYFHGSN